MADDRPSTYIDGSTIVYRASALGGCTKSLILSRMGEEPKPPPEWMQEKFDAGTAAELPILKDLVEGKVDGLQHKITGRQAMCTLPVGHKRTIRGHIDGLYDVGLGNALLEIKTTTPEARKEFIKEKWASQPRWAYQVSAYCHALGLQKIKLVIRDSEGTYYSYVSSPPIPLEKIKARIQVIEDAVVNKDTAECDINQFPCPYYHFHAEPERLKLSDPHLDSQIYLYQAEAETSRSMSSIKNAHRDAVIAALEIAAQEHNSPSSRFVTDKYEVQIIRGETKTFDTYKFIADHPDVDFSEYWKVKERASSIRVKELASEEFIVKDVF